MHSWPEALPVLLNAAQTRARPQARLQAAGLVRHHTPWWATAITAKGTLSLDAPTHCLLIETKESSSCTGILFDADIFINHWVPKVASSGHPVEPHPPWHPLLAQDGITVRTVRAVPRLPAGTHTFCEPEMDMDMSQMILCENSQGKCRAPRA